MAGAADRSWRCRRIRALTKNRCAAKVPADAVQACGRRKKRLQECKHRGVPHLFVLLRQTRASSPATAPPNGATCHAISKEGCQALFVNGCRRRGNVAGVRVASMARRVRIIERDWHWNRERLRHARARGAGIPDCGLDQAGKTAQPVGSQGEDGSDRHAQATHRARSRFRI